MSLEQIKSDARLRNQSLQAVIARFRYEMLNNDRYSFNDLISIMSFIYRGVEKWMYQLSCWSIFNEFKKRN